MAGENPRLTLTQLKGDNEFVCNAYYKLAKFLAATALSLKRRVSLGRIQVTELCANLNSMEQAFRLPYKFKGFVSIKAPWLKSIGQVIK